MIAEPEIRKANFSKSSAGRRVAVILSHPVQYYSPWFRWLAQETLLNLRVFYLWENKGAARHDPDFQRPIEWDVDLLSGYANEFVPNYSPQPGSSHFSGLWNPGLLARLSQWDPDAVVLFGYRYATHLSVLLWGALTGTPLIFRGDSHRLGREIPSTKARVLLRLLFQRFSAFLAVGRANREYFKLFGVSDRKIFFAPHAVDAARFSWSSELQSEAHKIRAALGIRDHMKILLFAGKFSPGKQPVELLGAFLQLAAPDWALVFVGSGAEEAMLRSVAAEKPAAPVYFLPFANQSEMPVRYALASLFALPSRGFYETWGLAVNEAMHLGVPAIVSDRVGCQRDLVEDGKTGWVFPTAVAGALKEKLREAFAVLNSPAAAARMRAAVSDRISQYNYAATTRGLLESLTSIQNLCGGNNSPASGVI